MINQKIFNAVLAASAKETKDKVIKEVFNHISNMYDYNDERASHFMAMLVDINEIVTPSKINLEWLNHNLDRLIYNSNKYNIKNIVVKDIDNIECVVRISFDYIDKLNEDRDDVEYSYGIANVSFTDYSEILK